MNQIYQNLRTGKSLLEEGLCSRVLPGNILANTLVTLVSAETKRMVTNFAAAIHATSRTAWQGDRA